MAQYDVHIYTLVRVKVSGIEAETMEEAIDQAYNRAPIEQLVNNQTSNGILSEWGEGGYGDEFLVDVVGDEEYEESQFFDCDRRPMTGSGHLVEIAANEAGGATIHFLNESYYVQPDNVAGSTAALIKKLATLPTFFLQEKQFENHSDHS